MKTARHLGLLLALVALAGIMRPALAQLPADQACALHVAEMAAALDAEGPRRVHFEELLALLRESERRGEDRLCRDLADDLRAKLRAADV